RRRPGRPGEVGRLRRHPTARLMGRLAALPRTYPQVSILDVAHTTTGQDQRMTITTRAIPEGTIGTSFGEEALMTTITSREFNRDVSAAKRAAAQGPVT